MHGLGLEVVPLACDPDALRKKLELALKERRQRQDHDGTARYLERLLEGVRREDLGLPHFPEVARELDALLAEDEPDDRKVLRAVEREPALVQEVWRIASTPPYRAAPRRLDQAITRVGLDRLWQLGVRRALHSQVFHAPGFDGEVGTCRTAGVVGAQVASWLAGKGRGSIYLAALLRDLGALWLYSQVVGDGPRDRPRRDAVEAILRELHPSLTCLALHSWGMEPATAVVAAYHHAPSLAPDAHKGAAAFVGLAEVATKAALDPEKRAAAATWLEPWLGDARQVTRVIEFARRAADDLG